MPPIRTRKRSNSYSGSTKTTNISLPMRSQKSKSLVSLYEDPEQARVERADLDPLTGRATRAIELEATRSKKLLVERDQRVLRSNNKSKIYYRQRPYPSPPRIVSSTVKLSIDNGNSTVDSISIPHSIQRKLIRTMNSICLTSAFNFTKEYRLPLTLNIAAPSPKTTRLTIHALTDAIILAYNAGAIPPESIWEDIAFGFVGVFEAARILDDAVLYYQVSLSDRRICAILLAGVDLLLALKDKEGGSRGEQVLKHAEGLIERAKRGRERKQEGKGEEEQGEKEEKEGWEQEFMLIDEMGVYEDLYGAAFQDEPKTGGGSLIMSPLNMTKAGGGGDMEAEELGKPAGDMESDEDK